MFSAYGVTPLPLNLLQFVLLALPPVLRNQGDFDPSRCSGGSLGGSPRFQRQLLALELPAHLLW